VTVEEIELTVEQLLRDGIVITIGTKNGKPLYELAPVKPGVEALATLADAAGNHFCADPRAWLANMLHHRADLRGVLEGMSEAKLLGNLAVALIHCGCRRAAKAAVDARLLALTELALRGDA
jgi:hypothetical protein